MKKYRPHQCPHCDGFCDYNGKACNFNKSFGCWVDIKGTTEKNCPQFKEKQ